MEQGSWADTSAPPPTAAPATSDERLPLWTSPLLPKSYRCAFTGSLGAPVFLFGRGSARRSEIYELLEATTETGSVISSADRARVSRGNTRLPARCVATESASALVTASAAHSVRCASSDAASNLAAKPRAMMQAARVWPALARQRRQRLCVHTHQPHIEFTEPPNRLTRVRSALVSVIHRLEGRADREPSSHLGVSESEWNAGGLVCPDCSCSFACPAPIDHLAVKTRHND